MPRDSSTFSPELGAEAAALAARFQARQALIGVVGLGYVGLPRAIALGQAGLRVLAFDVDPIKTADLEAGRSYIRHVPAEPIAALVAEGLLSATSDLARLGEADAILICTPTPLTRHQTPDLSFVTSTAEAVARTLSRGQLVVLESTTYPGTTREVVQPILERGGLRAGADFWLAYSPEREDPGNADFTTARIAKVVGADDADSSALAAALYEACGHKVALVSSAAAAEAVKISENIFRAVNIALANELKLVFGAMGVDPWEVIEAAKTKPFGWAGIPLLMAPLGVLFAMLSRYAGGVLRRGEWLGLPVVFLALRMGGRVDGAFVVDVVGATTILIAWLALITAVRLVTPERAPASPSPSRRLVLRP